MLLHSHITFTSLYTICVVEWCTPTQGAVDGVSTRFVEFRGLWLVSVSVFDGSRLDTSCVSVCHRIFSMLLCLPVLEP